MSEAVTIEGWRITSWGTATSQPNGNGYSTDAKILTINNDKYLWLEGPESSVHLVPVAVVAELLRRAGWKVEAPR